MKYYFPPTRPLLFLLILCLSCRPALSPQERKIKKTSWTEKAIHPGVTWKYQHFGNLFDSKQSVTILDIDLNDVIPRVEHLDSGFFYTSTRAQETGAIAAVNGSFFDTRKGGSVVFFQKDGIVLTSGNDTPRAYRDNAGFAIGPQGQVAIIRKPDGGWKSDDDWSAILSSGPLLVWNGQSIAQVQDKFNTNRHPRTAVGLTRRNHLIAIVADGRSSEAHGLTTEELARMMRALGCTVAMNLDGGGSSTAWVRGQPFRGVVNFPSDNKKFDHEGERAVANCIVFIPE